MAVFNLTNQDTVLNNCQLFKQLATNQLKAREEFLERLEPERLKQLYQSGKDPVLNELYDIYKGMDTYFSELREG